MRRGPTNLTSSSERGRTVHGEAANAGHRVLAPDAAEVEAYLETALGQAPSDASREDPATTPQTVIVLDFGSQTAQLIARRVRELTFYSELLPHDTPWAEIQRRAPRAIILSGAPASVYDPGAPTADRRLWSAGILILGICYGLQFMAHALGGDVRPAEREYGPATLTITSQDGLFRGLPSEQPVWMSHGDSILPPPDGFEPTAATDSTASRAWPIHTGASMASSSTPRSSTRKRARRSCATSWSGSPARARRGRRRASSIGRRSDPGRGGSPARHLRAERRRGQRRCGRSRASRNRDALTCISVDHGLMRKRESELLRQTFATNLGMSLIMVDARECFLRRLAGVEDPEEKRRRIGDEFIRVVEEEAAGLGQIDFLVHGTL